MLRIVSRHRADIVSVLILLIFLPLMVYNLGGHSLVDFDEAWYAKIASNILRDKNPILLTFNGDKYLEHPPLGFNIMAMSIAAFGHNEIAARLPSAIFAFGSIIALFLIGREMFSRDVGLAAAFILTSCVWFVYRARTADLDAIFLFFYLSTFFAALKSTQKSTWLYVCSTCFVAALLVKSMFALTLLLPILIVFKIKGINFPTRKLINPILFFILIILLAFCALLYANNFDTSFLKKYLQVGLKLNGRQSINILDIQNSITFQYLHFGIRKWFYPFLLAFAGSIFLLKNNKLLLPIYAWILILFFGFLSNSKTEIWHLIPMYPPLALITAYFYFNIKDLPLRFIPNKTYILPRLSSIFYIFIFFTASLFQIYTFKSEIKLFGKDIAPVAYLSRESAKFNEDLLLDTEVAVPAAASFYSGKNVHVFRLGPVNNTLTALIGSETKPFVLITEKWKLNLDKIPANDYIILAEKDGYVLIKKRV